MLELQVEVASRDSVRGERLQHELSEGTAGLADGLCAGVATARFTSRPRFVPRFTMFVCGFPAFSKTSPKPGRCDRYCTVIVIDSDAPPAT